MLSRKIGSSKHDPANLPSIRHEGKRYDGREERTNETEFLWRWYASPAPSGRDGTFVTAFGHLLAERRRLSLLDGRNSTFVTVFGRNGPLCHGSREKNRDKRCVSATHRPHRRLQRQLLLRTLTGHLGLASRECRKPLREAARMFARGLGVNAKPHPARAFDIGEGRGSPKSRPAGEGGKQPVSTKAARRSRGGEGRSGSDGEAPPKATRLAGQPPDARPKGQLTYD